jgi:Phage integrase family
VLGHCRLKAKPCHDRELDVINLTPEEARPHMLRHACGYRLANERKDAFAIQGSLGHQTLAMTKGYLRACGGPLGGLVSSLTVAVGGCRGRVMLTCGRYGRHQT